MMNVDRKMALASVARLLVLTIYFPTNAKHSRCEASGSHI